MKIETRTKDGSAATNATKEQWAVSDDGESYTSGYVSREDAIERGPDDLGLENGQTLYIGRCVPWELKINADMIIESLVDDAYEDVGEHADGFLQGVTPEQSDSLAASIEAVINAWMEAFGYKPKFFSVEDVEEINLHYDVV